MSNDDVTVPPSEDPTEPLPEDEVNLTPGPTDRSGHGGMSTREADARKAETHKASDH